MILLESFRWLVAVALVTAGCRKEPSAETLERRVHIQKQEGKSDAPGEALDRKQRSMARLRAEAVALNEHLPVIEAAAESKRRSTEDVAQRAVALLIVAEKGSGAPPAHVAELVADFDARKFLSPAETAFLAGQPAEAERAQFSWRYEAYWVLLWALGFIETLEGPKHECDVRRAVSIVASRGRAGFFKEARLRPQSEILDAADLIYRYHWAVRDAQVNGKPSPAGLNADIVMERHHALNWLIGYMDQAWDDVSTDT
jgi:hypothetical protein